MKKTKNLRQKSLIAAVALAAISLGFGTAGTVAFFKSSQSFDVEVTAAKVDVAQDQLTIVDKKLGFASSDHADVTIESDGTIKANLVAPGDTFVIKTSYKNNSTIGIKYRIGTVASKGLKAEVFMDEECNTPAEDTSYTKLDKGGTIADHYVKVTVEDDIGNGGTGKINVGVDAVQSNAYDEVTKAEDLEAKLAEGGSLALEKDMSLTSKTPYQIDKDTVLDLNGKTLSVDATTTKNAFKVSENKTLTIRGGNLDMSGDDYQYPLIDNWAGNVVFEKVHFISNAATAIANKKAGAHVSIKDCIFDVKGYYAIATNASETLGDQHDSSITITGSTITISNSENDNAALCFNAGGKYSVTDTTINAQRQGIIVRSGDLTLNDVIINKIYDFVDASRESGTFGDGNNLPQAALFLGSGDTGNYTLPSKVTFAGPVTFQGYGPKIVASGSTTQDVDLETGDYKGDVKIYDFRKEGDSHTFTINKQKIAIGTYTSDGTSKPYTI
ncbi:MAG: hypothetical protein PUA93_01240 [Eubacteriales bacterium]|nr:hypothetical protein [Eubacteriales bacterium]